MQSMSLNNKSLKLNTLNFIYFFNTMFTICMYWVYPFCVKPIKIGRGSVFENFDPILANMKPSLVPPSSNICLKYLYEYYVRYQHEYLLRELAIHINFIVR